MRRSAGSSLPNRLARLFALISGLWIAFGFDARAAEPQADFDNANRLFEAGKFAEAAAQYEKLIHQGNASAPVYFNLGNAHFRNGQTGRAIAAYRQAEWRTPRDPDLRANLDFARRAAADAGAPATPGFSDWVRRLTLNEWAIGATASTWVFFGLLAGGRFKPGLAASLATTTRAAFVVWVFFVGGLFSAHRSSRPGQEGVVIVSNAAARYGPFDESKSSFSLRDGTEVRVVDVKDAWFQVRDAQGRTGWLPAPQLTLIGR